VDKFQVAQIKRNRGGGQPRSTTSLLIPAKRQSSAQEPASAVGAPLASTDYLMNTVRSPDALLFRFILFEHLQAPHQFVSSHWFFPSDFLQRVLIDSSAH